MLTATQTIERIPFFTCEQVYAAERAYMGFVAALVRAHGLDPITMGGDGTTFGSFRLTASEAYLLNVCRERFEIIKRGHQELLKYLHEREKYEDEALREL